MILKLLALIGLGTLFGPLGVMLGIVWLLWDYVEGCLMACLLALAAAILLSLVTRLLSC